MTTLVSIDELVAAARAVRTTFDAVPDEPVPVGDPAHLTPAESGEIVRRYRVHGFAVFQLPPETLDDGTLVELAGSLGLGEAFVPPLYTMDGGVAAKITRISAARNAGTGDGDHPSFGRTVGQELHCDGTLQDIGFIKASLLLCETPAVEGGDTTLFNSSAAFAALVDIDMAAAVALASPGVLVRRATINGSTDTNAGPVFTVQNGVLVSHYCVSETDSWGEPAGVPPQDLRRGIAYLAAASRSGSPYFRRLRLDSGQAIVFDNTSISHGRTPYRDSASRHRCLYRSLHLRHPRVRRVDADAVRAG